MKGAGVAAVLAMIALVLFVQHGQAVVDCGRIDAALAPCIPFLTTGAGKPSDSCCTGVKTVKSLSATTVDKRQACECVKAAAIKVTGLQDSAAQSLPTKCGVTLDIPVSRTVNCDQIAYGIEQWVV